MKDKKQLMYDIILLVLSISLIATTLFVPLVHIVACDSNPSVVYDKVVSLATFTKDAVFLNTSAGDVYFNADGPMWLSVFAVMLNYLIFIFALVLMAVCIFQLATFKKEHIVLNQNNLAKKFGKLVGIFGIITAIIEIVSFILTTKFANGYGAFYPDIQVYYSFVVSVAILVFAILLKKDKTEQYFNIIRNSIGFGLTTLFSVLSLVLVFVPQLSDIFALEPINSIFGLTSNTNLIVDESIAKVGGDFPLGLMFYVIVAMIIACAFVAIYSIIGLIMTLCGKKANWLSSRVKRWSMAFLIAYIVLDCLFLATIAVLNSSITIFDQSILLPSAYFAVILSNVPLVASCLISFNKGSKQKKQKVKTK